MGCFTAKFGNVQVLPNRIFSLAAYYTSAVFLANIYTYLRGNQIGERFGLRPPTLEEYMEDR
jgi:hypothetical protein